MTAGPIVLPVTVQRAPQLSRAAEPCANGCGRNADVNAGSAMKRRGARLCNLCQYPPDLSELVCDCLRAEPREFGECARCSLPIVQLMHEAARERIYASLPGLRFQLVAAPLGAGAREGDPDAFRHATGSPTKTEEDA